MQKTLVAFDADRIKSYVFGTDKLKEIRGASALLDKLNRQMMRIEAGQAKDTGIFPVYTNGGQGLFVVIADDAKTIAESFGQRVQKRFAETTHGGASVTYVLQPLPTDLSDNMDELKKVDLTPYFRLIGIQMELKKGSGTTIIALPSHPLMHQCDVCGIRYAEKQVDDKTEIGDLLYCNSCFKKHREDNFIKTSLSGILQPEKEPDKSTILNKGLWERIRFYLNEVDYNFSPFDAQLAPQRPNDFHAFRPFTESKEYIGLIYADANNMGAKVNQLKRLNVYTKFAEGVDQAIHQAMSKAIKEHLPIVQVTDDEDISRNNSHVQPENKKKTLFPFDIFLVGGDDIVMLTDAAKAMDVALTIAQEFHALMQAFYQSTPELQVMKDKNYSLSIGVVLAPIKYPFRLMLGLAEEILRDAKKASAKARDQAGQQAAANDFDDTRIDFRIVNGGTHINQQNPYYKKQKESSTHKELEFYATLRPYTPKELHLLLQTIKRGQQLNLGRTKLHQMREAILKMNSTTSIGDGMAVLRNWNNDQRQYIMAYHRHVASLYQQQQNGDPNYPLAGLPRTTFPWFLDGAGLTVYRTPLLDLVELYDFVVREKGASNE